MAAGGRRACAGARPDPVLVSAKAMVFVDDPASPVLDRADAHHLLDVLRLRPGELVVAADGAGSWVACRVAGGAGSGSVDRAAMLVPDGGVTTVARTGGRGHRGLRPGQGGPTRVGGPEAHRARGGPDRAPPVPAFGGPLGRGPGRPGGGPSATGGPGGLGPVPAGVAARGVRRHHGGRPGRVDRGGPPCLAHPGGAPPSLAQPVVAVGPEGGWDDAELALAAGTVGLGPTVLRAETAAVAAGTLLCALRNGLVRDPCATTLREQNYYVERQGLL